MITPKQNERSEDRRRRDERIAAEPKIPLPEPLAVISPHPLEDFLGREHDDDWDRQMKIDAEAGRLDALVHQAMVDLRDGRCTDL